MHNVHWCIIPSLNWGKEFFGDTSRPGSRRSLLHPHFPKEKGRRLLLVFEGQRFYSDVANGSRKNLRGANSMPSSTNYPEGDDNSSSIRTQELSPPAGQAGDALADQDGSTFIAGSSPGASALTEKRFARLLSAKLLLEIFD